MPSSASVALRPHDRVRRDLTTTSQLAGVDLAATLPALHRSYILGASPGQVIVECARLSGRGWSGGPVGLPGVPDTPASDAVPTLASDRRDRLWCLFHNPTGNAQCWLSEDWGGTWKPWHTENSVKFPRAAMGLSRQYLAAHDGTSLKVWWSTDFLATVNLAATLAMPAQLVALRIDRRQRLHLVYTDGGGNLLQRIATDGTDFGDPITLSTSAACPVVSFGLPRGLVVYFDGATLKSVKTAANYQDPDGAASAVSISPALSPQCVGLVHDRRDVLWLCGQVSGATLRTFWTKDYSTWNEVL